MNTLNALKLQKRFVSSLLFGLPAAFIIWVGGALLAALLFVALALALLEWFRLSQRIEGLREKLLLFAGVFYILSGFYTFYILGLPDLNHAAFTVFLLVAASDVGAYFAGKLIGGAKLVQSISPNKTWAGLGGAMAASILAALLCRFTGLHIDNAVFAIIAGLVIPLSGQGGDLIISYIKRLAGVKDTGDLIPGHGGILDRIDSLLLSAPVFLLLTWLFSNG